jgi:bifunctional oligoribonuclease and PAP phosphatase NrnA
MDRAIDAVIPIIQNARRIVLTTHVNPDGDGLGSEVALAEWLRERGKDVSIINHSPTPAVYLWLDPQHHIQTYNAARDAAVIAAADLILVVDTNHPDRLRSMREAVQASGATKVCIDHHLDPSPFMHYAIIDDDATSTGEIIFRLMMRLNGPDLSPAVARALYCAIMTDTGSFRYPRVDPDVFRICAHLIERGADPVEIYANIYERWTHGRIHLLGEMLAGLKTEYDGRLAHVTITREMLSRTGTTEEDTDNFTTYPMSVDGVVVAILFLELQRGLKISFRSKGEIPINELAKEFGGNGHKNAAGARVQDGTLDAVKATVIRSAATYLQPREPSR